MENLGEENISKIFRLFQPMVLQYIIFRKEDSSLSSKKLGLNLATIEMDNGYLRDIEITEEREYIIIRLQLDVKKNQGRLTSNGWIDVSTNDFSKILKQAKRLSLKQINGLKKLRGEVKLLGTYQMIITGSEKDYWIKSEIDIHKFKINMNGADKFLGEDSSFQLSDWESESNISIFNKEVFGRTHIHGDTLGNLKLPTSIYGLGDDSSDGRKQLQKTFLLNLTVNSKKNNDNKSFEVQNKQFTLTINTVISNFGNLLAYIGRLTDLNKEEYETIRTKSNEIREKALKLQIKINNLLLTKTDKAKQQKEPWRKGSDDEDFVSYGGWEEKLLIKASRYFSLLTEINQVLARTNYQRNESAMNVDRITSTLRLTPIKYVGETKKEIPSLGLEFKQFSETINYEFQNLKLELDHSQSTLRNTVDILKTFLESEQRIVSQKMGELFNWIVIVFAGLGLADALGNFVIFVLEGGSPYDAMFWFFIILTVLFSVVVTLYFWLFKRPKYLGTYS